MTLFRVNKSNKLTKIKENSFKLEKEIQTITENNLNEIFNLEFVKSEFQLKGLRIDTLAYDKESKSFVIIEYKRGESSTVIDQGYAYLSLMLNNKAEFILSLLDNYDKNLERNSIDWSQSRIIFVSTSFSNHQKQAVDFKDMPIELWEVSKFEDNLFQYSPIKSSKSSQSITKISKNNEMVDKVSSEIKIYSEDDHINNSNQNVKDIYEELKNLILNIDENIEIKPKKKSIGLKKEKVFADLVFKKDKIKLFLNLKKGDLKEKNKLIRDVSNIGHWGSGDYEVTLSNKEDIPFVLSIIKYSYEKNLN